MNGLIEARTIFWPDFGSQMPHIPMANFNLLRSELLYLL